MPSSFPPKSDIHGPTLCSISRIIIQSFGLILTLDLSSQNFQLRPGCIPILGLYAVIATRYSGIWKFCQSHMDEPIWQNLYYSTFYILSLYSILKWSQHVGLTFQVISLHRKGLGLAVRQKSIFQLKQLNISHNILYFDSIILSEL